MNPGEASELSLANVGVCILSSNARGLFCNLKRLYQELVHSVQVQGNASKNAEIAVYALKKSTESLESSSRASD